MSEKTRVTAYGECTGNSRDSRKKGRGASKGSCGPTSWRGARGAAAARPPDTQTSWQELRYVDGPRRVRSPPPLPRGRASAKISPETHASRSNAAAPPLPSAPSAAGSGAQVLSQECLPVRTAPLPRSLPPSQSHRRSRIQIRIRIRGLLPEPE